LLVETIVVLGHADCGGVAAALARDTPEAGSFLDAWVGLLDPAKERIKGIGGDPARALEYESIRVSIENLMTFPFVARRVADGSLKLIGARYGIVDGGLEMHHSRTGAFTPVV
jgi:carbonic anhydrase